MATKQHLNYSSLCWCTLTQLQWMPVRLQRGSNTSARLKRIDARTAVAPSGDWTNGHPEKSNFRNFIVFVAYNLHVGTMWRQIFCPSCYYFIFFFYYYYYYYYENKIFIVFCHCSILEKLSLAVNIIIIITIITTIVFSI